MNKDREKKLIVLERVGVFVLTLVVLFLLFKFAVYFMPFLIAGIIAVIIEPVIKFCMNKLKMSRRVSSIIIVVLTIIVLVAAIYFGGAKLISEILKLVENLGPFITSAKDFVTDFVATYREQFSEIPDEVISAVESSVLSFVSEFGGLLRDFSTKLLQMLLSVPNIVITTVITIMALIFFCKDRIYVIDMMEHHLPKSWIKKITMVTSETFSTIGGYIRVYAKILLITFAELYLAFNIYRVIGFDISYPFLLAIVIALLDILPVLGVGTVLIPWGIWLLVTGDYAYAAAVFITYVIIFIIRQFIEPKLVSNQFGIHPLITLFAMYAGFKAVGVFGLLLGPIFLMILRCIYAKRLEKGLFKDLFDEK